MSASSVNMMLLVLLACLSIGQARTLQNVAHAEVDHAQDMLSNDHEASSAISANGLAVAGAQSRKLLLPYVSNDIAVLVQKGTGADYAGFALMYSPSTKVSFLKSQAAIVWPDISVKLMKLTFKGKELVDTKTLAESNIKDQDAVTLTVVKAAVKKTKKPASKLVYKQFWVETSKPYFPKSG